jgi:hypothetical protein
MSMQAEELEARAHRVRPTSRASEVLDEQSRQITELEEILAGVVEQFAGVCLPQDNRAELVRGDDRLAESAVVMRIMDANQRIAALIGTARDLIQRSQV